PVAIGGMAGLGGADLRSPTPSPGFLIKGDGATTRAAQRCLDDARRAQLDPYVAPVAELFLGGGNNAAGPRWDMSSGNKAKVVGAAGLV
ncbi:two-component sensor histidine kinase, partial [Streptomyces turgidiscabies]